ncbi:MAG: aldo/keto reductase [Eubacteriales bacterium]|nr:aldo/keto reductase [Eubacteriales bacterium]
MYKTLHGDDVGRMGMGTWRMAERRENYNAERDALRAGLEAGLRLIDTAEMYADGRAEALVGDAIRPFDRASLYIVSKVYPYNAGAPDIYRACEASLRRLHTDYLDMYLLHWRGKVPLAHTVECMETLKNRGLIRDWGVSNFDADDIDELYRLDNAKHCRTNQVLYHLGSRGIEYDLLPKMAARNLSLQAYCPLAQGGRLRQKLIDSPVLQEMAATHGVGIYALLLAFLLKHPLVLPIPCSGKRAHVLENLAALNVSLNDAERKKLDESFPPPTRKEPLDIV